MDPRRTRRDVLGATAGVSLALAAGCLDDGDATETDGTDETGDRSSYLEWALAASASSDIDLSELRFEQTDHAAIDAVSDSLPTETEAGLRESAYILDVDERLGEENVDTVFSFYAGSVSCSGFEGTFDVTPFREEAENESDTEHRTIEGVDVYSGPGSATVLSSGRLVEISGVSDVGSIVERVEAGGLEPEDEYLELVERHLDGAVVYGDLQPRSDGGDGTEVTELGYGSSVEFDGEETSIRLVSFYDGAPDDEAIAEAEADADEYSESGAYDDASVTVDGRALVLTVSVQTDRFTESPW